MNLKQFLSTKYRKFALLLEIFHRPVIHIIMTWNRDFKTINPYKIMIQSFSNSSIYSYHYRFLQIYSLIINSIIKQIPFSALWYL